MKETSLVYIIHGSRCLMLHRIRKKNDVNHGKWIGVGGKFEAGESPEECMRREVREETGLKIDKYRYCGIVTFQSDDDETEYMHLFLVTEFHGELKSCDEGELQWLSISELTHIPHWSGDRIFLSLILYQVYPFFSLKLVYRQGILKKAVLNEHNCLVTERLILRPWLAEDAGSLYKWAGNPRIGYAAGWQPHKSLEDSQKTIREILSRPELYAIVRRDSGSPIGCAGLMNFRITDKKGELITFFDERKSADLTCCSLPDQEEMPEDVCTEAELGYWLAEPFWGGGLMTDACLELIRHGFSDLGLKRIWCSYYEGNERSRRTQERLGFQYHHTVENEYVPGLKERRTSIYSTIRAGRLKEDNT